jgi:hypothetical protein
VINVQEWAETPSPSRGGAAAAASDPKRAKPALVDAFSNPGVFFQWSVVRRATQSLDVGAPLLRFQTPLLGTATWPRWSSRGCWRQ